MNTADEVFNHTHIVLCKEHYNPLGIIRSLGEAGIRPVAIIEKNKKKFVGSSKYISKTIYVESIDEAFNVLKSEYGNRSLKPFVYVTDDWFLEYSDAHYDELKFDFYITNAGASGQISYYMNKDNINQLAEKCGIKIPKSEVVKTGELPKTLRYPVITKAIASTSGAWKKDSFVCQTENELLEAYRKIKGNTMLLQEYIDRKDEINLDGISVNHGESVFLSMSIGYEYLVPGRYSTYLNVSNVKDDDLSKKLKCMIKEMHYEGIFDGEFMVGQDDEIYFLEVNFRPNAFNYASTCAGMNDPFLWAKGMLDGYVDNSHYKTIPSGFHAMVEPTDFKDRVIGKRSSFFRWLIDFFKCQCHYYFNIRDIKPFINFLIKKAV